MALQSHPEVFLGKVVVIEIMNKKIAALATAALLLSSAGSVLAQTAGTITPTVTPTVTPSGGTGGTELPSGAPSTGMAK